MYKVKTLSSHDFDQACKSLEALAAPFCPDLVIAIPTGGCFVAQRMFADVPHLNIGNSRPSTKTKNKHLNAMKLLRFLPRFMTNALRIIEAHRLARKPHPLKPVNISNADKLSITRAHRILIVDDAVDSGATMASLLEALNNIPGQRQIRCAAITSTTPSPLITPHFLLFNNSTLIRFPWAADAR